jgi:prevent-host-death family protein
MDAITITEASRTGVSGLVAAAQAGEDVVLSRHGRVVARIVSAEEMEQLRTERELLRDAALVMARFAADSGARTDLDEAMEAFGLNRAELEAELAAENPTI